MHLVIVHFHFRPGGVRRIIELATPHLAAALEPAAGEVTLVGGEPPDAAWLRHFRSGLGEVAVTCAMEPAVGYFSELRPPVRSRAGLARLEGRIRTHLERVLNRTPPEDTMVWAHNQGLGRNLLLSRALARACAARGVRLVFHHHDWWFDNRWVRWPEMRRAGFRTTAEVAGAILPSGRNLRHVAINRSDATRLLRHFGPQAGWLPNLSEPAPPPPAGRVQAARRWLRRQLQDDAPVWIVPCRLLRRKNVAEALLLTRWLRPEAWLVTTGGASSADEEAYAAAIGRAARRHKWRLRLGVLAGGEAGQPAVADLLAASEVVLLTSLQEGFGLPNLEAAAAQRPLIARRLTNVAPDLAHFGFRFPQAYDDIWVAPRLFDWTAEVRRQRKRWRQWRQHLPRPCRALAAAPEFLDSEQTPRGVPFSRLTLQAQLEVLAIEAGESWVACAPLNPNLPAWRRQAQAEQLRVSPWPRRAARWLGGAAYARRLVSLLEAEPAPTPPGRTRRPAKNANAPGRRATTDFIRAKLAADNQYPLLWSTEP